MSSEEVNSGRPGESLTLFQVGGVRVIKYLF